MTSELVLRRSQASGPLLPARLSAALARVSSRGGPRATLRGYSVRVAREIPLDHGACAAFALSFVRQGAAVTASGRGPSAAALRWCFHALAAELGCELHDAEGGGVSAPRPDAHRGAALAYLDAYERDVAAGAERVDAASFVAWLAREEHLSLASDPRAFASLPLDDAAALYEALLESDAVDEVFVGETELTGLLERFRARQ